MKSTISAKAWTLLPLLTISTMVLAQEKRPNIIVFVVDDMGWQDTSLPFHTQKTTLNHRFHTPNMERLASMGAKFTQAYASSVSSPSRCSLLTGANAARHRVTNWTHLKDTSTDEPHLTLGMPQWNVNGAQPVGNIPQSFAATSFAQILAKNGYHTIHCGKAHFGATETPAANPLNYGFDVNIAGHAAGGLASYLGTQRFGHDQSGNPVSRFAIPGLEQYWVQDIFVTEALTLEAIKAIDKAMTADQPFLLHLAHYAVHVPIQADQRFVDKYLQQGLPEPEAAYASMVEGMDKSLGDIMDFLEEKGALSNTIILFISDNGGYSLHGRTPPLHTHNAPLRSGKGAAYEGGIRVPMIVYWNEGVQPGSVINDCVIIEDCFPSLLEIANIERYETLQTIDGESFVPLLKGKKAHSQERLFVWNMPNNWIAGDNRKHGIGPTCTIRQGDYKLIYWYEDGKKELYDIKNDISETTDLSCKLPRTTQKLSKLLSKRLRKMGAQRPIHLQTGKLCLWPDGKQ